VRKIMASLVKTSVAEKPVTQAVPVFFERAPFFRDDEPEEKTPPPRPAPEPKAAEQRSAPVAPALAMGDGSHLADVAGPDFELDFTPAPAPTHYDFEAAPAVASQSFELEGEQLLTVDDIAIHDIESPSFELDVEEPQPRFVRCVFDQGKWSVEQTAEPKQPREGFTIADPGDQREIDQFCKTYEYADPDTRRMIRVSCELMIAQQRA
jgi:hypothetical protein